RETAARLTDVPRYAAGRLRRGGGGGGNRAPRPAAADGVRARAVRVRPAANGRADDAERGVQRQVRDAAGRVVPPQGPPLRVVAGGVPGVDEPGGGALRLPRRLPSRRAGRSRRRRADADGRLHPLSAAGLSCPTPAGAGAPTSLQRLRRAKAAA